MDEHLPIVLCQLIVSYFADFRDIDNLLKLTENTKYIFESNIYAYVCPKNKDEFIEKISIFPKLRNICFCYNNCYVTDEFIKNNLTNVHYLYLGYMSKITDDGLQYLSHVHILNLGSDSLITDKGLKHLITVNTLNLGYNSLITNEGLKQLEHTIVNRY
jgi:hypothetical protein